MARPNVGGCAWIPAACTISPDRWVGAQMRALRGKSRPADTGIPMALGSGSLAINDRWISTITLSHIHGSFCLPWHGFEKMYVFQIRTVQNNANNFTSGTADTPEPVENPGERAHDGSMEPFTQASKGKWECCKYIICDFGRPYRQQAIRKCRGKFCGLRDGKWCWELWVFCPRRSRMPYHKSRTSD